MLELAAIWRKHASRTSTACLQASLPCRLYPFLMPPLPLPLPHPLPCWLQKSGFRQVADMALAFAVMGEVDEKSEQGGLWA